ncbi:MAG TPA: hypothetical protein VLH19_03245 [Patescibacteria group bacterium]|nr:hypothetical protein [Patescibacteria group bacterium]
MDDTSVSPAPATPPAAGPTQDSASLDAVLNQLQQGATPPQPQVKIDSSPLATPPTPAQPTIAVTENEISAAPASVAPPPVVQTTTTVTESPVLESKGAGYQAATTTTTTTVPSPATPPPEPPKKGGISAKIIGGALVLFLLVGGAIAAYLAANAPKGTVGQRPRADTTACEVFSDHIHCPPGTYTKQQYNCPTNTGVNYPDCICSQNMTQSTVTVTDPNGQDFRTSAPSCGSTQVDIVGSGGVCAGSGTACTTGGNKTCGQTCTSDSECIAKGGNGSNVGCRAGLCQNLSCIGKTVPGANCDCSNLHSCGSPCSAAIGLCQTGSSCRYINGSACTDNPNPSNPTNTYCVPPNNLASTHTWDLNRCVARDTGNSYATLNGVNPTVAQIQAACQPKSVYTCQSNPFTDTFDSSPINARYYVPTTTTPTISNGQLVATITNATPTTPATQAQGIQTNAVYSGDFQVDVDSVSISTTKNSGAARLVLLRPDNTGTIISLSVEQGPTIHRVYSQQGTVGSTTPTGLVQDTTISNTAAVKLRLVRKAGTIVASFDAGSGYKELGTYTDSDDVGIRLVGRNEIATTPNSVVDKMDNFSLQCPSTASPSPSPSPSPTPTSTPAPVCINITKDVATPLIGSQITFTCGQVAGADKYEFRYKLGSVEGALDPVNAGSAISKPLSITQAGSYSVQCRPCVGALCSEYEAW